MRFAMLASLAWLLCSPAHGQTIVDESGSLLSDEERALLPQIFRYAVPDPSSVQIAELKKSGNGIYCAAVNAKNRFGAYQGYALAILRFDTMKAVLVPLSAEDPSTVSDEVLRSQISLLLYVNKLCGF